MHIYNIESFAKKLGSIAAKRDNEGQPYYHKIRTKCLVNGNMYVIIVRGPRYYKRFTVAVGRSWDSV